MVAWVHDAIKYLSRFSRIYVGVANLAQFLTLVAPALDDGGVFAASADFALQAWGNRPTL